MPTQVRLVSVIMPVCNEGDEARHTIASAQACLREFPHEIVVVDDHSLDGSCHGMPRDVLVVRSERRMGISAARRLGFSQSRGDVIVWSDAHCRYPAGSLPTLVERALVEQCIVEPKMEGFEGRHVRYGARLALTERGVANPRCYSAPAAVPALHGSVYAMSRDVYERLGGWPKLPGIYGGDEEALSLQCWFAGVPIRVELSHSCFHRYRKSTDRFPYSFGKTDRAQNAHFIHAAFFPETYADFWRPVLEQYFGRDDRFVAPLQKPEFRSLRNQIISIAVRSEAEFFGEILRVPMPATQKPLADWDDGSGRFNSDPYAMFGKRPY